MRMPNDLYATTPAGSGFASLSVLEVAQPIIAPAKHAAAKKPKRPREKEERAMEYLPRRSGMKTVLRRTGPFAGAFRPLWAFVRRRALQQRVQRADARSRSRRD